ncbi:LOW QUALITY PROTEIN: uncharacterized protein [Amphiura filiformis]|uniref:LOW QUALITY PROTEIN: uncharacterized protein n=1 Tax=Amphiura filiformis TaxID=82378 RepID=UPI003B22792C
MPRAFLVKKKVKLDLGIAEELHDENDKESADKEADCREKPIPNVSSGKDMDNNTRTPELDTGIAASFASQRPKTLPCLTIPKPFHDQTSNVLRSMLYRGPKSPERKLNDMNDESAHAVNPRSSHPLTASAHSAFDKVVPGLPRSRHSPSDSTPSQTHHSSSRLFQQLRRREQPHMMMRHSDSFKDVMSFRQRGEDILKAELASIRPETSITRNTSTDEPLNLKINRHDDSSRPNSVESTTSNSMDSVSPLANESDHIPKKKYFLDRQSFQIASDRNSPVHNNINLFAIRTPRYTPSLPPLGPDPRSHLNWAFAAYYQQPCAPYGGPYSSFYSRVNRRHDIPEDMRMLQHQTFHSYTSHNNSSLKKDISDSKSGKSSSPINSPPPPSEDNNDNQPLKSPKLDKLDATDPDRSLLKPEYREYLSSISKNIRTGTHHPQSDTTRPLARQPILGLEYIQNGTDIKVMDVDGADCPEEDEGDTEEQEAEGDQQKNMEHDNDATGQDHEDEEDFFNDVNGNVGHIVGAPETVDRQTLISPPALAATTVKLPQPKKYKCDICFKGFSRSNTLVTHKRIHTGDKPFKCELCGRAFRQPGNLTRHRLTHTTVKPYVCPQCDKAFNRASNLHTHMRTHTNYKPFTCPYCDKGFHQKIDMKIHSYTHTGEKPHKCKTCGRGFKQLTHLTYHMRTHSAVKMYTCAYCGKGFNQKGNLQAHIYGHTGERPYRCEICDKGFTLASTLNTHRRTHAEKKPFQCQYCQKDFYQKNALKSHLIASHPYTGESLL